MGAYVEMKRRTFRKGRFASGFGAVMLVADPLPWFDALIPFVGGIPCRLFYWPSLSPAPVQGETSGVLASGGPELAFGSFKPFVDEFVRGFDAV